VCRGFIVNNVHERQEKHEINIK